ncbi:MAG: transaldolase [Acidimicrobiales bacterium]
MTKFDDLFQEQGQSPWIDNLKRSYLTGGQLAELVSEGVRGVTSNPTIFAKAIEGSDDYDADFAALCERMGVEDAYWALVTDDISQALSVLRPVYDESGGTDGFVSLEVAPSLAHDTDGTIGAARGLHERIHSPNLLVKIPATAEGVPAIRRMIAEGRSINVTLIFSLERYAEVIEAYLGGLEDLSEDPGADLGKVASVASFFVSRVDTEVDRRLERLAGGSGEADRADRAGSTGAGGSAGSGGSPPLALRGKAAVAQAKLAYRLFRDSFSGPRWEALAARGAKVQRPLWASTSTKNPAYPDLLYVDSLVGPDTVDTMPDVTVEAFLDHGVVARTVDRDVEADERVLEDLGAVGVDMADVARVLEDEGVASFAKSFDELIQQLSDKANAMAGPGGRPEAGPGPGGRP